MATFTFQRGAWCLQISRTSRNLSVSFSTALPRRSRAYHLPSQAKQYLDCPRPKSTSLPKASRHQQARTAFTSTKVYQAQQSAATQVPSSATTQDLQAGLDDQPTVLDENTKQVDWAHSFHGLSTEPFSKEAADVLLQPIPAVDVEVKPDGIIYLPEIKYRRILNKAFGPGGWGLAPRGETIVTAKAVTREYALVVLGRLVSVARGEQDYFNPDGIPTAAEGCKSNALLRCCKDLGVASELWDPVFIRQFKKEHVREVWVEHMNTKQKKKIWLRKDAQVGYPFKETKGFGAS